jgi:hypothetical protein
MNSHDAWVACKTSLQRISEMAKGKSSTSLLEVMDSYETAVELIGVYAKVGHLEFACELLHHSTHLLLTTPAFYPPTALCALGLHPSRHPGEY